MKYKLAGLAGAFITIWGLVLASAWIAPMATPLDFKDSIELKAALIQAGLVCQSDSNNPASSYLVTTQPTTVDEVVAAFRHPDALENGAVVIYGNPLALAADVPAKNKRYWGNVLVVGDPEFLNTLERALHNDK